jgi:cold shock protein
MADRQSGVVKWFDSGKGYGFIERSHGADVFVHYSGIRGKGFRSLEAGDRVTFEVVRGPKGEQAEDVVAEG